MPARTTDSGSGWTSGDTAMAEGCVAPTSNQPHLHGNSSTNCKGPFHSCIAFAIRECSCFAGAPFLAAPSVGLPRVCRRGDSGDSTRLGDRIEAMAAIVRTLE
jgi:hypothetical protein